MPTAQGLRPQVSRFLLIQLGGAFLGVTFWLMLQLPAWTALLVAAMSCTLAAWRWHDGRWWLLIHALFLPLALGFSLLNIDPLWYLLAFGVSWLVFGHVARTGVPLYLSNRQALQALAEIAPQQSRLLDVGAGTGTVLAALRRARPDLLLSGIEHAWLPWLVGRLRLPKDVSWRCDDYRHISFADTDLLYAFLSPLPMADLWQKAQREMKPGSLFISNTFSVPGQVPDQIIELNDWKRGRLLLWRM